MHMLEHLPPRSIAALLRTCRAFQKLIEEAPADLLSFSMQSLLPPNIAAVASTGRHLLRLLLIQQAVVSELRSGQGGYVRMTDFHMLQDSKVLWASGYASIYLLAWDCKPRDLAIQELDAESTTTLALLDLTVMQSNFHACESPYRVLWAHACPHNQVLWLEGGSPLHREFKVLDLASPDDSLRCSVTGVLRRPTALCSRNGSLLVPRFDFVQVLDSWTLDEKFGVRVNGSAATGFTSDSATDDNDETPIPTWCDWSHDGQLFAVAWTVDMMYSSLTFHDTSSMAMTGCASLDFTELQRSGYEEDRMPFTCFEHMRDHLDLAWSPTAASILVRARSIDRTGPPPAVAVEIIDHTGLIQGLHCPCGVTDVAANWSSCGRFLHVQLEKQGASAQSFHHGYIWDTFRDQSVFTWRADGWPPDPSFGHQQLTQHLLASSEAAASSSLGLQAANMDNHRSRP